MCDGERFGVGDVLLQLEKAEAAAAAAGSCKREEDYAELVKK